MSHFDASDAHLDVFRFVMETDKVFETNVPEDIQLLAFEDTFAITCSMPRGTLDCSGLAILPPRASRETNMLEKPSSMRFGAAQAYLAPHHTDPTQADIQTTFTASNNWEVDSWNLVVGEDFANIFFRAGSNQPITAPQDWAAAANFMSNVVDYDFGFRPDEHRWGDGNAVLELLMAECKSDNEIAGMQWQTTHGVRVDPALFTATDEEDGLGHSTVDLRQNVISTLTGREKSSNVQAVIEEIQQVGDYLVRTVTYATVSDFTASDPIKLTKQVAWAWPEQDSADKSEESVLEWQLESPGFFTRFGHSDAREVKRLLGQRLPAEYGLNDFTDQMLAVIYSQ